jgi:iron complex outermembrane receptor protein
MRRQSILWSPSAVTVITRDEIRTSGANEFHDLLRRVPGMDVFDMKTYFPSLGMRALAGHFSNRVLLLIDGREQLWELTGGAVWGSLSIDLEEVERIEIIRGPAAALYGANAFAGVINVITVSDKSPARREAFVSGGNLGRLRVVGRVSDGWDAGDGLLDGSLLMGLEGKRGLSDFRDQPLAPRIHGYLRYRGGIILDLSLHGGMTGGEGLFYMDMGDLGFIDAFNYWAMARGEFALGRNVRLKTHVYHMYAGIDFHYRGRLQAYGTWVADMPDMFWSTYTFDSRVQLEAELAEDLLLTGGVVLRYNFLKTERMVVHDDGELRGAGFAQIWWAPWSVLQVTGGVHLDLNTDSGLALSPRAAVVYRPWPRQSFRLSYASAFRKPSDYESRIHTEIENYNPATSEIVDLLARQLGNEDLVNEKVHAFEAGWRVHLLDDSLQVTVDLFFNLYSDMIFFEVDVPLRMGAPDISNSIIRYENDGGDGVRALGGEAGVSWRPDEVWSMWCNLGLRRVTSRDTGDRVPADPQIRVNFGGRYAPATGMFIDVAMHYVSDYRISLRDPMSPLDESHLHQLGDSLMMFARTGYRVKTGEDQVMEGGVSLRLPIGEPFREWAGIPAPQALRSWDIADIGGEVLGRLITVYFRGSF